MSMAGKADAVLEWHLGSARPLVLELDELGTQISMVDGKTASICPQSAQEICSPGPVVRLAPDEVDVTDIDAIKQIYDSKETFKKSSFYRNLTAVRAPVLFVLTDVTTHRRMRRLMSTPMSASSLKLHVPLVQSRVNLYIQSIKNEMLSRGCADVFKWNMFLATDLIGELSFGESFKTLEHGEKNQYVHLVESIGPMGAVRSAFPRLVSLASIMPLPILKSAANASREIRRYGEESLGRYYKLASKDTGIAHQTLFTKLRQSEQDGEITFEEICANAQGYILAGSDTTASTLTYLIWSVCRRPHMQQHLVQQLEALPPDFDDDDLRNVAYLSRVIDETLRLFTAAPSGLPREVPAEGASLAGYQLGGGTVVCAQSYSMHRDPDVFPDPEEFDPLRWEDPSKAMMEAFMPFGRGPRSLNLARMELRIAAASFFRAFPNIRISAKEGFSDRDMQPKMFFVSNPVGRRCLVESSLAQGGTEGNQVDKRSQSTLA
ncbi:hypothetical protein LLEC1_03589 [Akanthomyces lecanii]|uniref:Cytochrome P450 n=1 Tax=Cordyceps confragosa TaxID=2714763 RepID=A0A179I8T2_CORDF|nr:hypothetical protein LLEC1_03589 [Akanthomyces lecanii]